MIIDLTRRPLFVNTDICLHSIVLRTAQSKTPPYADGVPRREFGAKKKKAQELAPSAIKEMPNGVRFQEMILPITHGKLRPVEINGRPIGGDRKQSGDPFVVRTYYTDVLTKLSGVWEAKLTVEEVENKNGTLWIVSVFDVDRDLCLVALTAKGIGEAVFPDTLPLTLLGGSGKKGRPSAWDRLRELDTVKEDVIEFPDE